MDINSIGAGNSVSINMQQAVPAARPTNGDTVDSKVESVAVVAGQEETAKSLEADDLQPVFAGFDKFFQMMNVDLQFSLHEKTQRLMVKLVDTKENKVLKEFPPEEFLNMVARIQEYVGVLLDKRA